MEQFETQVEKSEQPSAEEEVQPVRRSPWDDLMFGRPAAHEPEEEKSPEAKEEEKEVDDRLGFPGFNFIRR
ncbi:hypothetical protein [Thalassobacillus sp. C254]|uniref:hypothetical protein n=1 Tax=Thalassobacillus sp. C254 TaxID=1225341 RepID=UPI0018DD7862|nr:hypothetical protein [Thalassobacillus sp. C254]